MAINSAGDLIAQPRTFEERENVAAACVRDLRISIPCLVDDIEDTAARAYLAFPDRLFIVGLDGRIAFTGEQGPFGFKVKPMKKALLRELTRIGALEPSAAK